jgi:signal recognition particle subunit SRP54
MKNMGGMAGLLDKLPGMGQMAQMAQSQVNDKTFGQMEAIICSMTPKERRYPDTINNSRKRRIAAGSGTQIQDINRLLKQHKQMQKMMKKFGKKGGMQNMMRGMKGMMPPGGGGMPPFGRM